MQAALTEFRQDLSQAGKETVLSRAARLRLQCENVDVGLPHVIESIRPAGTDRRHRSSTQSLLLALTSLHSTLRMQCEQGLRAKGLGDWADSVRAWGPSRADRIDRAVRAYEAAAGRFATTMGFRLEPARSRKG